MRRKPVHVARAHELVLLGVLVQHLQDDLAHVARRAHEPQLVLVRLGELGIEVDLGRVLPRGEPALGAPRLAVPPDLGADEGVDAVLLVLVDLALGPPVLQPHAHPVALLRRALGRRDMPVAVNVGVSAVRYRVPVEVPGWVHRQSCRAGHIIDSSVPKASVWVISTEYVLPMSERLFASGV